MVVGPEQQSGHITSPDDAILVVRPNVLGLSWLVLMVTTGLAGNG
jgi:hypothetical protein